MSGVIFTISAILIGAGALSIYTGAPVIQLERGWAEVIAGTVALSGGCVTLALGMLLARLKTILHVLQSQAYAPPAPSVTDASAPPTQIDVELAPRMPPAALAEDYLEAQADEPLAQLVEPVPEPPTRQGLWKRFRGPGQMPKPDLPHGDAPTLSVDIHPVIPGLLPVQPEPSLLGAARLPAEEPDASHAAAAAVSEKGIGWLDRGLESSKRTGVPPFAMRPTISDEAALAAGPPTEDMLDNLFGPAMQSGGRPSSEGADTLTVVGRYQAGSMSYVLYSNGTIEVESEGEIVRRFGSMSELKTFIHEREASET